MSSPAPAGPGARGYEENETVSIRPVRLKVLYTFDNENKTNCLARWPHILTIRTAFLDQTTQIGVIELKTCIQAIVAASPELVAKLGQDYTVYAYDYSEYDTPLVGQGMLSWVLASASATPSAPAHQSRTVVTGRICKNILGLFSQGTQETLEVKLRLVPVPTCLQSEYLESMRKYRDISRVMPEGFDAQAWTDFIRNNPDILSAVDQSGSQSPAVGGGQRDVGIEHVQRLMGDTYPPRPQSAREPSFHQRRDSYASSAGGQDQFRNGSPVQSTQLGQPQSLERPNSRTSTRGNLGRTSSRRPSMDLGYVSSEERIEEGPSKKRAKITKVDWPAKSTFGKQVDSLRVAASTAASVRVYQPTAVRAAGNVTNSLEEPPRAPTPVPMSANHTPRPTSLPGRSSLRRESNSMPELDFALSYTDSTATAPFPESAMTSPGVDRSRSTALTPAPPGSGLPPGSSPPTMHISPPPSSPVLPPLHPHDDSGFMSASIDELFGDNDMDEDRTPDALDLELLVQYNMRPGILSAEQSHAPDQVSATPPTKAPPKPRTKAPPRPKKQPLSRTASSGDIMQATPSSDAAQPSNATLHRAQTWSGKQPEDDISLHPEGADFARPKSRSGWNKVKRKAAIQSKLVSSIAAGELPPFCDNCGNIETPTWRKAYSKIHCGSADQVQISNQEGGVVACQILETNEDGTTKLFKIFKKSLLETDEGFTDILLCNPCGLWFSNHKEMRPSKCWQHNKPHGGRGPRKGGPRKRKSPKGGPESTSLMSEALTTASDSPSPEDGAADDAPAENDAATENEAAGNEKPADSDLPPPKRKRASSAHQLSVERKAHDRISTAAFAALERAVKSSPGRSLGSRQMPIELPPGPTRRTLFPSPKSTSPLGHGDGEVAQKHQSEELGQDSTAGATKDADKENLPPMTVQNDYFDDLFDDLPTPTRPTIPSPPARSSPHDRSSHNPFKTPTKATPKRSFTTADFFSSAARAFLHPPRTPARTPSRTPSKGSAPLSLGAMTPLSRQLHALTSEPITNDSPARFLREILGTNAADGGCDAGQETPSRFLGYDFDFNAFGTAEATVPSSPPPWFGVYEDPMDDVDRNWGELSGFTSSPLKGLGSSLGMSDLEEDEIQMIGTEKRDRAEGSVPVDA